MYTKVMKRALIFIFALLLTAPGVSFAQNTVNTTVKPEVPTAQNAEKPADTTTLAGRRATIETDLRALHVRLGDLATRTTTALTRLNQNNVDVTTATKSLTLAKEKLAAAQIAIDAFAKIELTPTTTIAPTGLRENLQKAETALRDARNSIVESLFQLRTTITTEPTQ